MNNQKWNMPNILLRLEGTAVFLTTLYFYTQQGFTGWVFWALLLWPDIAIVAYAVNKQSGAFLYNLLHTYAFPIMLIGLSVLFSLPLGLQIGLIWTAHIGMDRLFGYGLKYMDDFKSTHLGRV